LPTTCSVLSSPPARAGWDADACACVCVVTCRWLRIASPGSFASALPGRFREGCMRDGGTGSPVAVVVSLRIRAWDGACSYLVPTLCAMQVVDAEVMYTPALRAHVVPARETARFAPRHAMYPRAVPSCMYLPSHPRFSTSDARYRRGRLTGWRVRSSQSPGELSLPPSARRAHQATRSPSSPSRAIKQFESFPTANAAPDYAAGLDLGLHADGGSLQTAELVGQARLTSAGNSQSCPMLLGCLS